MTKAAVSDDPRGVLDQHVQIFANLVQMSDSVKWLEPSNPDPVMFDRVTSQLGSLRQILRGHFVAEENGKLHSRLLEILPDAGRELDRLNHDHRIILATLEAAQERANRCSPLHIERLRDDIEVALEALFAHEAVEDQLMARAFSVEDISSKHARLQ